MLNLKDWCIVICHNVQVKLGSLKLVYGIFILITYFLHFPLEMLVRMYNENKTSNIRSICLPVDLCT